MFALLWGPGGQSRSRLLDLIARLGSMLRGPWALVEALKLVHKNREHGWFSLAV